ncbi:MAG: tripartite tricarboxylate transporter TctB family protein [Mailhella sp.]|jgi:hypothetical protein|nr:tripartite tricarboxylate transporter TctB family protein [Mailhella sp.]
MRVSNQEFTAALSMTLLTGVFAIGTREISGEAAILPTLLLWCMGITNVLQYALAIYRGDNDINLLGLWKAYPFKLVLKSVLVSCIYVMCLIPLGFYFSSFVFMLVGSLLVNPDPLTKRIVMFRILGCFGFVFGLWALFSWGLGVLIPTGTVWPW